MTWDRCRESARRVDGELRVGRDLLAEIDLSADPSPPPHRGTRHDVRSSSGAIVAAKSIAVNVLPNTSAITATGSVKGSGTVTVRGTLTFNETPAPAGTTITVSRNENPSLLPATPLPSVTTGSGGVFTVTDKPGFAASFVYTVSYPGDAAHGPAIATVTVGTSK